MAEQCVGTCRLSSGRLQRPFQAWSPYQQRRQKTWWMSIFQLLQVRTGLGVPQAHPAVRARAGRSSPLCNITRNLYRRKHLKVAFEAAYLSAGMVREAKEQGVCGKSFVCSSQQACGCTISHLAGQYISNDALGKWRERGPSSHVQIVSVDQVKTCTMILPATLRAWSEQTCSDAPSPHGAWLQLHPGDSFP